MDAIEAIRRSNNEVGGRLIEWAGAEFMVRGKGYVKSIADLGKVVVKTNEKGTPVLLQDVATIALGPQIRRGLLDLNGQGDAVGGIVVMRHGENALNVIDRVKAKLEELKASLPEGVEIVTTYDRSELIRKSIDNLKEELLLEMIIVSLVILFFLWHIPSALVPIITIPISVLLAFIPMFFLGITSNIMSLAGIAISIGVLVDGAIVEVENAYKKLELWQEGGRKGDFHAIRLEALMEVGPSVFFSLVVIAVSFLPIFTLVDQEGRLFTPLAYTKTLALALGAVLAVTLDPAVRMLFTRMDPFQVKPRLLGKALDAVFIGKYYPEEKHPISRVLFRLYEPPCRWVLKHPKTVIALAVLIVASAVPVYLSLGREFMPPLNEGTILYMPTTTPGISVTEAQQLLETQDRILKSFPEVESVFGKAGRADTSTDPAPFSMMETTVVLKPQEQWRSRGPLVFVLGAALAQVHPAPFLVRPHLHGRTDQRNGPRPADPGQHQRLDHAHQGAHRHAHHRRAHPGRHQDPRLRPGRDPAPGRGAGKNAAGRPGHAQRLRRARRRRLLRRFRATPRGPGPLRADGRRPADGHHDRRRRRDHLHHRRGPRALLDQHPLPPRPARQPRPARSASWCRCQAGPGRDGNRRRRTLQVPMAELADIRLRSGPSMIRDENGMLAGYVFVDIAGRDLGSYVDEAKKKVGRELKLPTGYSLLWSGQYENMLRVKERLKVILPITIFLIFVLLYMNTKSVFKTFLVMLAVPFSVVGAVWLLSILGYNVSIAAWVGMIALMGLDAETGVFMLLFLDLSYDEAKKQGRLRNMADLHEAIIHGAVKRIRPKMMTVGTAFMGLMPIMWSMGTGADMMKRVAAPMVGGLFTSFVMELLVYPAIYLLWKWHTEVKKNVTV